MGGKITRTRGPKIGREDGVIAAQKGEFVIKKSSVRKYGSAKLAEVNAGRAKVTVPGKGRSR